MNRQRSSKHLAIALGAAVTASMTAISVANASDNPFSTTELSSGYQVADKGEGKCGEGKCGEGKCGEGQGQAAGQGGQERRREMR